MTDPRIKVWSSQQGYQYRVWVGGETDDNGDLNPASADRIVGGWKATESQAEAAAREVLADE
jgi:hypothetical protein